MFTGILNATQLKQILQVGLLPFIQDVYPDSHRLYQDNNPKHRSKCIADFFEENGVVWWPAPPESPDLNPIENIWGSLKQFLKNSYKPSNLAELKQGVEQFWSTLTPEVCQKYISHVSNKVIPKVIEVRGEPSGY